LFSGNHEARGASGEKYKARIAIFCILLAINRFSQISRKAESHGGKLESHWRNSESRRRKRKAIEESQKAIEESQKAVEESRKPIWVNRILCKENWILGEENWILGEGNLDILGEGKLEIPKTISSIWRFLRIVFPTRLVACLVACVCTDF
jgi:hypothetical protein